ncbi:MAG: PH domain-containing protein [Eubacterium sp.]|nr:PH domain-containing protein [Eubacterium sp.]
MSEVKNAAYRSAKEEIVWSDRKHHLWFPLSFTKYKLSPERLYITSGFFSSREDECLLYRILDISLTRSFMQRLFGTGTVEMNSKDRTTPVIKLENIKKPADVKRMLSLMIEEERESKKVVGKDMYGSASHIDPMELDPDMGHDYDDMDHYHY